MYKTACSEKQVPKIASPRHAPYGLVLRSRGQDGPPRGPRCGDAVSTRRSAPCRPPDHQRQEDKCLDIRAQPRQERAVTTPCTGGIQQGKGSRCISHAHYRNRLPKGERTRPDAAQCPSALPAPRRVALTCPPPRRPSRQSWRGACPPPPAAGLWRRLARQSVGPRLRSSHT